VGVRVDGDDETQRNLDLNLTLNSFFARVLLLVPVPVAESQYNPVRYL
jgi:hypothetical protein